MKEMTDEDLFMEGSDVEESDIEESDIEDINVDEDEVGADPEEDEVVEGEDEYSTNLDEDSPNLQGGAKKKSGEDEEASEAGKESDNEEDSSSEAGASEAGDLGDANEDLSSSDSDDDEDYLQKFNQSMRDDLIMNFHSESKSHNYEEIKQLAKVMRNKNGIIMDELHKTIPILTKYEKTRILGQRAKQIETGAIPLVQVPPNIIDSYLIAKLELAQNKIPFIIRRPLPSGGMEYWYVSDLENL